jgi:hypothetical protein
MSMDSDRLLEGISRKLDTLISMNLRLLMDDRDFAITTKRKKNIGNLVSYFAKFKLDAKAISAILGVPVQSVRTFLTPKMRRKYNGTETS